MVDQRKFLNYINDNYTKLKHKYARYCKENNIQWDEDTFSDTILKCYDAIKKKGGLDDCTDQGIENYFFKSFKMNIMREKQYARNMKRDLNVEADDVDVMYITEIDAEFEGDTYFPQFDENLFTKEINGRYVSTVPYTYVTYTRK